jgi:small subunit ribosomal protein S16
MLAIRMQRTGRKGHAQFRLVVQDARRTPTSGNIIAQLGHYDPHAKTAVLDKEKATFYLEHGAQPSPRVVSILKSEKVALPKWVTEAGKKSRTIRNADKLRRNRPAEEQTAPADAAAPADEPAAETPEPAAAPATTEDETTSESSSQKADDQPSADTEASEPPEEAARKTDEKA